MTHGLTGGEAKGACCIALRGVNGFKTRAQNLRNVRGVGDDERDSAQERDVDTPRGVERRDAEADQVQDDDEGDSAEKVGVGGRKETQREEHGASQGAGSSQESSEDCYAGCCHQQHADI